MTYIATKQLDSGMGAFVHFQIFAISESFLTFGANVRTVARMEPFVNCQVTARSERFLTVTALVWP